jgi:hypothetical protein
MLHQAVIFRLVLGSLLCAASPVFAASQALPRLPLRMSVLESANGSGDVAGGTLLAVNMALGGLTAAVWHRDNGHSFWREVARGSLAGGAVFAGKRLIATESPLAWWSGREIAAIGSSEVLNAAEDAPFFNRVTLPLGPLRVHFSRSSPLHLSAKLDLATTVSGIYLASQHGNRFAWRESLSSGAPVFLSANASVGVGTHSAGAITLSKNLPDGSFHGFQRKRGVLSHEMVHAAQYDFISIAWGNPLEDVLSRRFESVARVHRFVDFGVLVPVQSAFNALIPQHDRPWEREAGSFDSGY